MIQHLKIVYKRRQNPAPRLKNSSNPTEHRTFGTMANQAMLSPSCDNFPHQLHFAVPTPSTFELEHRSSVVQVLQKEVVTPHPQQLPVHIVLTFTHPTPTIKTSRSQLHGKWLNG